MLRALILIAIVAFVATGLAAQGNVGQRTECAAPEFTGVLADYDALVCRALSASSAGEHAEAVRLLREAGAMHIEDNPNVSLLPRLALEEWRAGYHAAARVSLAHAEIAIQVVAGVYVCTRPNEGAPPAQLWTRAGGVVDPGAAKELVARMCDESYEGQYGNWSLDGVKRLAGIIGVLEEARRTISGQP